MIMTGDVPDIVSRKGDHLIHARAASAQMRRGNGFERWRFLPEALPELDFEAIDLGATFLGRRFELPFLISSMTGGMAEGERINRNLAIAAGRKGIPLALGSQRVHLERPEALASFEAARRAAPEAVLYGNLGAVQLNYGLGPEDARRAVEAIGAQGLYLHLNALQEAVQEGGDTRFSGLTAKIAEVCAALGDVPVLVKEVGCGIAPDTALRLEEAGVSALDVAGAGGTSWARIEAARATDPARKRLGEVFGDWGLDTAESLARCAAMTALPVVASGGVRDGLEAAKAIALGASLVGVARPFLEPALEGPEAVEAAIDQFALELRTAMFLVGAEDLLGLRARRDRMERV